MPALWPEDLAHSHTEFENTYGIEYYAALNICGAVAAGESFDWLAEVEDSETVLGVFGFM
jgi:hypothetical protein